MGSRRTHEMAASLLALGLDPERCTLFVQSHRPEHTELAWLLCTVTPVSWLERTPTYKEKKANQPDDINHGWGKDLGDPSTDLVEHLRVFLKACEQCGVKVAMRMAVARRGVGHPSQFLGGRRLPLVVALEPERVRR